MRKFFVLLTIIIPLITAQVIAQNMIFVYPNQAGQLNAIMNGAPPGTWIVFADGIYQIPGYYDIHVDSLTLTSNSGNPETVIITGDGMTGYDQGFMIVSDNVTISNMTIQNVRYNCIYADENTDGFRLTNCILRDAGEFFIKVLWTAATSPSENGIIEDCIFEYPAGSGVNAYMGGIEGSFCKDWIIRNNIFKSIRSPSIGSTAYAILFWRDSEANLVERNHIIDCDRGIGFGIGINGNSGGIIRNNFIYHRNIIENDQKGITLESSPYTQVYNNTVYFDQDAMSSVEYRFNTSIEILIANNLANKPILARDGASATDTNNVTFSFPSWFTDLTTGDLHLSSDTLSDVIDQGINIPGLVEDFDGDSRPQGAGIDIGADEYTSSTDINWYNNVYVLPKAVKLYQNYPNPFNPETVIRYHLPSVGQVELTIYNILGQKVKTLFNKRQAAGEYQVHWSGTNEAGVLVAGGVYIYQLQADRYVKSRKMLLLR